jgi:hypothetical protein
VHEHTKNPAKNGIEVSCPSTEYDVLDINHKMFKNRLDLILNSGTKRYAHEHISLTLNMHGKIQC